MTRCNAGTLALAAGARFKPNEVWHTRSSTGKEGDPHAWVKIMYSLGALAMLAMAVGAGFKPN
jgi:hypothetical protein